MADRSEKSPRVYRFAESHDKTALTRRNRDGQARLETSLHMQRDADVFAYVFDELNERFSYRYGDLLFNLPEDVFAKFEAPPNPGVLGRLQQKDLIVRTSRPTVPYHEEDGRYHYGRSSTPLELANAASDREFFHYCNREGIWLSETVCRQTGPRDRYARVKFQQHGGGRRDGPNGPFIGYASYQPSLHPDYGVAALNVFSIDGVSSLLWAYVLTRQLRGTLSGVVASGEPTLLIGEFDVVFPNRRIEHPGELDFPSASIVRAIPLNGRIAQTA